MAKLNIYLVLVLVCHVFGQNLWREDGRCGKKYPLSDGSPGQCDPNGNGPKKGPCCSPKGFCGNTDRHCKCGTCKDYSITKVKSIPKMTSKQKTITPTVKKVEEKITSPIIKKNETREETKTFQISQGEIKGHKVTDDISKTHFEFRGIPYAQPPLGRLRFKPPFSAEKWKGTFEAFENGRKCLQMDDYLNKPIGSEDCLFLNIYTKNISHKSERLPVMIWIHGGGFTSESGDEYVPTKLIEEGVIVVTINYRLGGFGFLTFGNDKISGNMGLRDQAEAIQWVKRNIGFVGGDPNKITIFGESAGGISVHAQVLSPKNFGQLAGAIAQSGSLLLFGDLPSEGRREEKFAAEIVRELNCSSLLDQSTLSCLQQIDSNVLLKSFKQGLSQNPFLELEKISPVWRPVVDNYATDPFIPITPLEAMKTGIFNRIPFMSGTVKNEGVLLIEIMKLFNQNIDKLDWERIGPKAINLKYDTVKNPTKKQSEIANIIKQYYLNDKTSKETVDQPIRNMFTDALFVAPDQITVRMMSQHNPAVFDYHFTQKTNNSLLGKLFYNLTYDDTPAHGDEVPFLLEHVALDEHFSGEELDTEKIMMKLWSNFAKFGNPTPSSTSLPIWNPVDYKSDNIEYMELSSRPVLKKSLYPERMLLWDRLVWGPRLNQVDNKLLYVRATEFLQKELEVVED